MQVRKATQEDLSAILKLEKAWIAEGIGWAMFPNSKETLASLLSNHKKFIYVLEDKQKVVGYFIGEIVTSTKNMSSMKINKGDKFGEIIDVFISKKYRGKDLGELLLNQFLSDCKKAKVKLIKLRAVSKDLFNLVKYYKKFGFVEKSVLMVLENP